MAAAELAPTAQELVPADQVSAAQAQEDLVQLDADRADLEAAAAEEAAAAQAQPGAEAPPETGDPRRLLGTTASGLAVYLDPDSPIAEQLGGGDFWTEAGSAAQVAIGLVLADTEARLLRSLRRQRSRLRAAQRYLKELVGGPHLPPESYGYLVVTMSRFGAAFPAPVVSAIGWSATDPGLPHALPPGGEGTFEIPMPALPAEQLAYFNGGLNGITQVLYGLPLIGPPPPNETFLALPGYLLVTYTVVSGQVIATVLSRSTADPGLPALPAVPTPGTYQVALTGVGAGGGTGLAFEQIAGMFELQRRIDEDQVQLVRIQRDRAVLQAGLGTLALASSPGDGITISG